MKISFMLPILVILIALFVVNCGTEESVINGGDSNMNDDDPIVDDDLPPPSRSPILSYCPFTDTTDFNQFEGRPVIRVCHEGDTREGCHVNTLVDAVNLAVDGTRIEIVGDGGIYNQCVNIRTVDDVEFVGVCGTPHIRETVCSSKGAFVIGGDARNVAITNVEVSNLTIPISEGGNAAAVRAQGTGGGLALKYVYFHDNQNGVLGGLGDVTIDWSKFEGNGSSEDPGRTHNIYFDSVVDDLTINNSIFLRAHHEGNNMKTRAKRMTFHCSVSASLDGADSREIDISNGGELIISNSIIEQGPESANNNIVGFATEANNPSRRHDVQSIVIRDTDIINDRGNGTFLAYNAFNGLTVDLTGVRFIGAGTTKFNINEETVLLTEDGNVELADREAAGLSPYSTDHMNLPQPPGCSNFEYW